MFTKGVKINFTDEDSELRQYLEDTTISCHFDVIIFTIPITYKQDKQNSFRINNLEFDIGTIKGYRYFHKPPITADDGKGNRYVNWECCRYRNLKTKNPVDVHQNQFFIRIMFHSEYQHITANEINEFMLTVAQKYCDFFKSRNFFRKLTSDDLVSKSFISSCEVAIDFIGGDLYFQHIEMLAELYKKSERTRKEYEKKDGKSFCRGDYEFYNHPTFYGGKRRSGQQRKGYVKSIRHQQAEKFFRHEVTFRRAYLKSHNIYSLEDIMKFNLKTYWEDNFIFFDLDWDKIMNSSDGRKIPLIAINSLKYGYSAIESYRMLSKRLRNRQRFIIPKWSSLTYAIQEALQQASLALMTGNKQAQGAYQTHQTVITGTIDKIIRAKNTLISRGIKPSTRTIKIEAGVAHATASKYKEFWR